MMSDESIEALEERINKHDEDDKKRFEELSGLLSSLAGRVTQNEKRIARGTFLGVLAADLIARGVANPAAILDFLGTLAS